MVQGNYIRLTRWAARHGMHRMTAWRHWSAGTLPPELKPKKIGSIVYVLDNPDARPAASSAMPELAAASESRTWNRKPTDCGHTQGRTT